MASRRVSWWIALAVLVCAAVAGPAAREFRTLDIESLRITIDSDWVPRTAPGYVPVRFDVTNLGDARVIEIVGRVSRFFRPAPRGSVGVGPGGQGSTTVRQELRLAKGDRVRFTMSIPVLGDSENIRFELREDNRVLEHFAYVSFQSRSAPSAASVLLVADSASPFGLIVPQLTRTLAGVGGGRSMGTVVVTPGARGAVAAPVPGTATSLSATMAGRIPKLDYVLEPARLPVNWTGFTSVRAVALGKTEWDQLSEPQKAALLTWVACGGDLIFVDGQLSDMLPSMPAETASGPVRTVGRHFFGRVHALTSATLEATGMPDVLAAVDLSANRAWSLPANGAADWGSIEARGFRVPIPGIDGAPARVYLGILVLFSLLIGPASFWFLWRRKQRVLIVLTAPILSLLFILVLATYTIAGEGFGVHGRAATFTILDEGTKQAATRATMSLYAAGMAPSGGLNFGRDVAVFLIGPSGSGSRERGALDLSQSQRYATGEFQARSPTNVEQILFRRARERLTFTREAGGYSVLNGLDATLTHLQYRDGQTRYTLDGPLAPGARQTLKAGSIDPASVVPGAAIGRKFEAVIEHQPPDSYIAVLDRSPFWEPGVSNLMERGSFHLVLGWPQGQR
jgi:hypothetical protein